jgi:hypothetical protein
MKRKASGGRLDLTCWAFQCVEKVANRFGQRLVHHLLVDGPENFTQMGLLLAVHYMGHGISPQTFIRDEAWRECACAIIPARIYNGSAPHNL